MARPVPRRGFTLIELMIVVAIIGILAAIAIPQFADMVRKANEANTRGNLGSLRSAISVYYADMEGQFPSDALDCLTADGKYLKILPVVKTPPFHADSNEVCDNLTSPTCSLGYAAIYTADMGKWIYWSDSDPGTPPMGMTEHQKGDLWVGCTHTDQKAQYWTSY